MTTSRVVVADDDAVFADALSAVLAAEAGVEVVATAARTEDAYAAVDRCRPGLLVLDADLPGACSVPELLGRLHDAELPTSALVVLRAPDSARLLGLLEAGAIGCVTRDQPLADVVASVHRSMAGEATVPRPLLGQVLRELVGRRRRNQQVRDRFAELSRREREVLALLAGGHDQQQIADILVISPETVRTHIHRVTGKLGVRSRVQAASLAVEHDLVDRRVLAGGSHAPAR